MEYEQIPQAEEVVYELPKWAKLLFRFYAVIFLLGTIFVGARLVYFVTTRGQELSSIVTDSQVLPLGSVAIALFALAVVILILEVIYGIGVYKLKRWVLPLILTFSFTTLLIGLLRLVNLNFDGIAELIGLLIGMTFMGTVGYAAIKYWSMFTGSARKLLVQIPLLLVLSPFILFATLSQIFIDDAQINDSDLVLQPVELIAQSDNAHYTLPDIDSLSAQQQRSYEAALQYAKESEGLNLNNQEAINFTNQTRNLTDAVIEASSKKGYQCPTLVNNYSIDAELCSLNDMRDLAVLTAFRADVEADTGNKDQAIMTAVSVIQFGSLIGNAEQPNLLELLVGIAVMNFGLESLERTLHTPATTTNQTIRFAISDLEQAKLSITAFTNSFRREYMMLKDTSKPLEQFSSYFYQHNKTVNQRAEIFRRDIAILSQGCEADTSLQQQQIDQLVEEMIQSSTKWPLISPNYIGKIINGVTAAHLYDWGPKACELNDRVNELQELLRMELFEKLQ